MRPHGTYSIVARDPVTAALGVAVQPHWFCVGAGVPWAEPGVGVVAAQSVVDPAYGARTLGALKHGETVERALAEQLDYDEVAPFRQLGAVDAAGQVAAHTGDRCIREAGHVTGEGFSCQANMMRRAGVPEAMAEAFRSATGPLAERLVAALEGAERAGGDVRGRQSAALLVVPGEGEPWRRDADLRVDDAQDPVGELRRLLVLHRAYALANDADELAGEGRHDEAAGGYAAAAELAPSSGELLFWAGLGAAQAGDLATGVAQVSAAIGRSERWREVLDRLEADIAPSAAAVRAAL